MLTREEELELARRVEEGEHAALRAVVGSAAGLRELSTVGENIAAKKLRLRDVLRAAEEDERTDGETAARLAAALDRAARLAAANRHGPRAEAERRRLHQELQRIGLHRRVLERVIRRLRAAPGDEETRTAILAAQQGLRVADDARAVLVESNFRLVVFFARRFLRQGLLLHDLIQEGNIGLMRAIDKFEWRRGHRFTTYAAWWVKQQMARALSDQGKAIRVPVHLVESRRKVRRAARSYEQRYGRPPTEAELVEDTGLPPEKVRTVEALAPEPLSLHAPVGPEGDIDLGDFATDRTAPAPDEEIARRRMHEQARELLALLTPREREILRRRFGLEGSPEHTLEEIGASLALSRERIRQIQADALRKLRAPSKTRELETYLVE